MSGGLVLSFLRRQPDSSDWTQQELAEFYRVESALLQGGLSVITDRGISDEGDPWFVFCRADTEEVIAHFARIGREYVIVSNLHSGTVRGADFRLLVRRMIDSHPLMLPVKRSPGQKILLHPAAMLTAMLASAYFLASDKDATYGSSLAEANAKNGSITSLFSHKFAVLAAASLAAIWIEHQADAVFKFLENTLLFQGTGPSDDSGAHVAQFTHEIASLDTAIMQAIRDIELGSHRIELSSSNDPVAPQNGADAGHGLPISANQGNAAISSGADENSVNLAASNVPGNNDHSVAAHSNPVANDTDGAATATNPLPILAAKDVMPALLASAQLTPTSQSGSPVNTIVATSEAVVQLATSDIVSSSIQPIVLSNGAVPLNLALEQASAEVGLDTNLSQNSTAASSSPSSNPAPPVASASISQIMHTVEAFLHNTPSFEVTVSGSNVVIIDTKLSDASSPDFGVLTWDLHNGSTLSIVGIIPHHHAPATA